MPLLALTMALPASSVLRHIGWPHWRAGLACAVLTAGLMAGMPAPTRAADTAPVKADDKLSGVRSQVAAKRWPDALAELRKVNDSGSADWNNLMGHVLRKGSPADLDGADRHYGQALRIDPRHKGALEYSGELALMRDRKSVV